MISKAFHIIFKIMNPYIIIFTLWFYYFYY